MANLILLRAELLCLHRALFVARRDHKPSKHLLARIVPLQARVAAMETTGEQEND